MGFLCDFVREETPQPNGKLTGAQIARNRSRASCKATSTPNFDLFHFKTS